MKIETKEITLTEDEIKALKTTQEDIYKAAVGYVMADVQKSQFFKMFTEGSSEFDALINGKLKMSGIKGGIQQNGVVPDLEQGKIIITLQTEENNSEGENSNGN